MKLGDRIDTNSGICEIVKYNSSTSITVKFINTGYERSTSSSILRRGTIKDPYVRSVAGIGYLGEGDYAATGTKAYDVWRMMIQRCYVESHHAHAYYGDIGVKVCEDWHCFQTFAIWYYKQPNADKAGFDLDKDLLNPSAKSKLYSPKYCSLVPQQINKLLYNRASGKKLPPGVFINNRNKYEARVSYAGKSTAVGTFDNVEQASAAYKEAKTRLVRQLAKQYEHLLDKRVFKLLRTYTSN